MKFNNLSFPHPVLGIGDAVDGISDFLNDPSISVSADSYKIEVECNLVNTDLEALVGESKAEFLCEATCTNTIFRNSYKSSSSRIEFEIPKKSVRGKVEFICLLVLKQELSEYTNQDANSDYDGFKFDLDEGDILAVVGEFTFDADIKYEKLKAVSSFMEVVENTESEYTNIDLKKPKIEIQLPTIDYDIYKSSAIAQESKYAAIFHSSVVLNALLIALYSLEEYDDYSWAKALKYRLDSEDQFKELTVDEKENIPEIAQRLLGNPFSRLLNALQIINNTQENEE